MMRALLSILLLVSFSSWAANTTTPGTLNLSATMQCIGVKASFTGDANANNACAVTFRVSGGTWHNAYTPIIDRRQVTGGDAYTNQARVVIMGLSANTSYDVAATWTDADGVTGTASITNTISTLTYVPPTGGSTITVSDDAGLTSALGSVVAGQTIHLNPGTYKPVSVTRSGSSGAYIVIEGDAAGTSIIQGTNISQNIALGANFIMLSHLTLGPSDHSGVVFTHQHDVFIQDCVLQNISVTCAADPTGVNYSDCGINMGASTNVFCLRNTILSPMLDTNLSCRATPAYAGPGTGIAWLDGCRNIVNSSNYVIGAFRDAMSLDDSATASEMVQLSDNRVKGYLDDGIESKGANINTAVFGNRLTNNLGNTFFAFNDNLVTNPPGPIYLFRNFGGGLAGNTAGGNAYKLAIYVAPIFMFHNTMDLSGAGTATDAMALPTATATVTYMNNILEDRGSLIAGGKTGDVFDYNVGWITIVDTFAYNWNGATTFNALVDFQTGTGQETHGLQVDPLLNGDLSIPLTSPSIDAGVTLANFNDAASAWPASGSGPDMGAFEVQVQGGGQSPGPVVSSIGAGATIGHGAIIGTALP